MFDFDKYQRLDDAIRDAREPITEHVRKVMRIGSPRHVNSPPEAIDDAWWDEY